MNNNAKFALKVVLIIVAVGTVVFLVQVGRYYYKIKKGDLGPNITLAKNVSQQDSLNSEEIIGTGAPSFGSLSPELTIVEFGSFSCPYSKESASITREAMLQYKDKVQFIYRDYPLDDIYPDSSGLALAGKCANEQDKFWIMHDQLYQTPTANVLDLAQQIGLDTTKFLECIQKQTYLPEINQELLDGFKNGVAGTPTFFFIKKGYEDTPIPIPGSIPKDTFIQVIEKLLETN